MNSWQKVFRDGIAPQLSTPGLDELHKALRRNDPALLQGQTTDPLPCPKNDPCPVAAACPIALAGWRGQRLRSVAEVEEFFAQVLCQAGNALGDPAAGRPFFQFADTADRQTFLRELRAEVIRALAERVGKPGPA